MTYSVEKLVRIYNDDTGDYYEIREDRDGLGLVELVAVSGGKECGSFTLEPEAAQLFCESLYSFLQEFEERLKKDEPQVK